MKTLFTTIAAALLAVSFAASADAAAKKQASAAAQQEASCKAQAAKKYSVVRFLARRNFVNECMGRTASGKAKAKRTKA